MDLKISVMNMAFENVYCKQVECARLANRETGFAGLHQDCVCSRISTNIRAGIRPCFSRVSAAQPPDGAEKESYRGEEPRIAGGKSQVAQGSDVTQRDQHHRNHNQEKCAIHKSSWR